MFVIALATIISITLAADSAAAADTQKYYRSDYQYEAVEDLFYKLHREAVQWYVAQDTCLDEGASLIESQTLGSHIRNIVSTNGSSDLKESDFWLDLQGSATLLHENTTDTSLMLPFVCVIKSANITLNVECNTTVPGYELGPDGTSCYKYHVTNYDYMTWGGTVQSCHAEGGHLAIVNSVGEAEHLIALVRKRLPMGIVFAVGFHDLFLTGEFNTLDGNLLSESGYVNWAPGQPDGDHCGVMDYPNRKMWTYTCDRNIWYYMCEKEVVPFAVTPITTSG